MGGVTSTHEIMMFDTVPLTGEVPWAGLLADEIEIEVGQNQKMLEIPSSSRLFEVILHHGLTTNPDDRSLTFELFRENLQQAQEVSIFNDRFSGSG